MEFSRYLDPKIVMRYFHNSRDKQCEITDHLGNLFSEIEGPKKKRG